MDKVRNQCLEVCAYISYIYTYICIYIYVCVYIYVCIYIYICVCNSGNTPPPLYGLIFIYIVAPEQHLADLSL